MKPNIFKRFVIFTLVLALTGTGIVEASAAEISGTSFLRGYFAAKERQARDLERALKLKVAPEVWAYFEAGSKGDWNLASNLYAGLRQRCGQYQGTTFDSTVATPAWQPVIETVMARDLAEAWGETEASRFGREILKSLPQGSVIFAGTDPGRGLISAFSDSHSEGHPVFTLTQNAVQNDSYWDYIRQMYGGKLDLPATNETHQAFVTLRDDLTRKGQKFSNEGVVGVFTKLIFDRNPARQFFVEESFPLEWMYSRLTPHGLVMYINRQPLEFMPDEEVSKDQEFWTREVAGRLGGWLTETSRVEEVCTFVEKVYVKRDYAGFMGDRDFVSHGQAPGNFYVGNAYAKLRSSIGGIYLWRARHAQTPVERERMQKAADFAFRQAFVLDPGCREAVFRYADLLVTCQRPDDAIRLAEASVACAPQTPEFPSLLQRLRASFKSAPAKSTAPQPSGGKSAAERLKQLKSLFEQGLITKEDYDKKVKEIVGSL